MIIKDELKKEEVERKFRFGCCREEGIENKQRLEDDLNGFDFIWDIYMFNIYINYIFYIIIQLYKYDGKKKENFKVYFIISNIKNFLFFNLFLFLFCC